MIGRGFKREENVARRFWWKICGNGGNEGKIKPRDELETLNRARRLLN